MSKSLKILLILTHISKNKFIQIVILFNNNSIRYNIPLKINAIYGNINSYF
jgi:hypothetical protein